MKLFNTLAVILALLLTACGGSSGVPEPTIINATSDAQAGDERTGAALLVLPLPGPVLELDKPALVTVRLEVTLAQTAHYAASGSASVDMAKPWPSSPSTVPLQLPSPDATPLRYSVQMELPAGSHPLAAQVTVRATDVQGLPTGALARATATAVWTVEVEL